MEKAVLKTLIYADIFDYPMTIFEIHKWLIGPPAGRAGKKVDLRQVESALNRLKGKGHVLIIKGYYVLPQRKELVKKRLQKFHQSVIYLRKAKIIAKLLKVIPWIKLVGVSGGLAMENVAKTDDIDFFIITSKNRLWLTRLLVLGILSLTTQRRKPSDSKKQAAGKICCNLILEEDRLEQERQDIYTAHEVLQMKVLWDRGVYGKYLEINAWAFKYLPNWIGHFTRGPAGSVSHRASSLDLARSGYALGPSSPSPLALFIEDIAKRFQLKIMGNPKGMERIEEGAVYFHPTDYGVKVLQTFKQRIGTP